MPTSNDEAFALIASHLSPHKAEAFRALGIDLVQGRREGVRIWGLDGRDYINCRSSGGVFNFGHHPKFAVDALATAVRGARHGRLAAAVAAARRGRRGAGAPTARAAALHLLHGLGRRGR